uniref:Uncharacterized protein n=1 Tax=Gokushovirinae environmental samples TaxID=1478972 RepID=A0A2R3UAE4_9VIRU|nr:hypothetical protein [Gokushovirinae environmental samples]
MTKENKASIRILHTENRVAKNGSKYKMVHCLITIDGQEYVRRFALFTA